MKTIDQIKMALKKEYPVIKIGSDLIGYTDLSSDDYEATIAEWANHQLTDETKAAANEAVLEQAANDKAALLTKMSLTADEAKLLLS